MNQEKPTQEPTSLGVEGPQPQKSTKKPADTLTATSFILGLFSIFYSVFVIGFFFAIPGLIVGLINIKKTTRPVLNTIGIALNALSIIGVTLLIYLFMQGYNSTIYQEFIEDYPPSEQTEIQVQEL
ncbi:MAG TPA: hypothetical protein VD907_01130 [Verrucomicrobiae bacterium]|nr:hypothetical protein [Verrucomicrobiae bacterium]